MNPGEIVHYIGANRQIPAQFDQLPREDKATVRRLLQSTIENEKREIEDRRAEKGDAPVASREQRLVEIQDIAVELERRSAGSPLTNTIICLCVAGYSMAAYHCPIHGPHRQDDFHQTVQVPKSWEVRQANVGGETTSTEKSVTLNAGWSILRPDGTVG